MKSLKQQKVIKVSQHLICSKHELPHRRIKSSRRPMKTTKFKTMARNLEQKKTKILSLFCVKMFLNSKKIPMLKI